MPSNENRFLTIDELAELLRVSSNTIRKWRHGGRGPQATKVGGRVIFARDAVDTWLASQAELTAPVE